VNVSWEIKKIGDLFDITSSKRVFKSDWKAEGVPFYRAREIVKLAEQGFVDNELFISEEMFREYSTKYGIPKAGDIMVTGVGTLGRCYVVKESDRFYFKDGNIIWLKKKSDIDSRYVEYAFESDHLRKQIDNSVGATVGTYTIIKAKNTSIPVPPLPEQKRIVRILDEAFANIEKARANTEKNLQNARALFESYLNEVFANDKTNWRIDQLKDICTIKPPKSEVRKKLTDIDDVSFVPMEDLGINQQFILPSKTRPLSEVIKSYTYFADGDVLLAKITPCFENGKLGIADNLTNGVGFGSSEYIVLRPKESFIKEWLYYYLQRESFREEGKMNMTGAVGHKRVSKEFIESYPIPIPPLNEQRVIVKQIDGLWDEGNKLMMIYNNKLKALDDLKKSLLHHAFSGKL